MNNLWALAVPVIVFLAVVMPIWLILHYRNERMRLEHKGVGDDEVVVAKVEIQRLQRVAVQLDQRIDSLERILDAEFTGTGSRRPPKAAA